MFPDAEGWDSVDPDEAAQWVVGSEFPPESAEQSRTEGEASGEVLNGTVSV